MSAKKFNHLWNTKEIQLLRSLFSFSCEYCYSLRLSCFIMKSHLKCNKCTQHDHSCVAVSWESLDRTHLQLWKEISTANAELSVLTFKIVRLQKTLDQANRCALQKADCLAVELDSDNDETEDENNPQTLSHFVNSMSSSFWDSISLSQSVKALSHSSWGFVVVLMCFQRYCILFIWWGSGFFC